MVRYDLAAFRAQHPEFNYADDDRYPAFMQALFEFTANTDNRLIDDILPKNSPLRRYIDVRKNASAETILELFDSFVLKYHDDVDSVYTLHRKATARDSISVDKDYLVSDEFKQAHPSMRFKNVLTQVIQDAVQAKADFFKYIKPIIDGQTAFVYFYREEIIKAFKFEHTSYTNFSDFTLEQLTRKVSLIDKVR